MGLLITGYDKVKCILLQKLSGNFFPNREHRNECYYDERRNQKHSRNSGKRRNNEGENLSDQAGTEISLTDITSS